jgi:hypothetical protein
MTNGADPATLTVRKRLGHFRADALSENEERPVDTAALLQWTVRREVARNRVNTQDWRFG